MKAVASTLFALALIASAAADQAGLIKKSRSGICHPPASSWTRSKWEKFANDPVNLIPVEASLNRSKGAHGPESWLPPSGKCQYVSRFVRIVKTYGLQPNQAQLNRYKQQLADYCG
nr:HNH endonuclease family protein [Marinobacter adhaerens]